MASELKCAVNLAKIMIMSSLHFGGRVRFKIDTGIIEHDIFSPRYSEDDFENDSGNDSIHRTFENYTPSNATEIMDAMYDIIETQNHHFNSGRPYYLEGITGNFSDSGTKTLITINIVWGS
jgi:hypothetical protein